MAASKKQVDPFEDDDSVEGSEQEAKETKAEPADEPAFDLELNEEEESEEEEPRPTRKQKRANRFREVQERAERAEREREEAMRTAQLALLRAEQASQPSRAQEPGEDPFESELNGLDREQDLLNREWALLPDERRADNTTAEEFIKKARAIERKKLSVAARRELAGSRGQSGGTNDYIQQRIRMDYPDVCSNAQAMQYAEGYCRMQMARGRPMDWTLMAEGMEETRKQFGNAKAPPPTRETQQRYTGAPRGMGGSASTGKQSIKMTAHYMALAEARYPDEPKKVAYQKWANTVGRKLLAKGQT
jgi:hypothetical protein